MRILFYSILLFIGQPVFAQWENSISTDEMTGEVSAYCFSPFVASTKSMSFPYNNTKA